MLIKNGEIQFEHSSSSSPSSPSSSSPYSASMSTSSSSNDEYELVPGKGDLLVVRKMLAHVHKDIGDSQRENTFHSRCLTNNKVFILIIGGESSTLVDKLNHRTIPYPRPYKLQWLTEDGEIKLTNQVLLSFSNGKYKDEVLCDMVSDRYIFIHT